MDKVEVEILGLSASPASNGAYALILQEVDGDRRLAIVIGSFEASAIALEMEDFKPSRPMTHDLCKTLIKQFDSSLDQVVINGLKDGTYYAQLEMQNVDASIDARPSDAIALAVRFKAPIYVVAKVMDEASFKMEETTEEQSSDDSSATTVEEALQVEGGSEDELELLRSELILAIEKEDYEKAAILRDEIAKRSES